MSDAAAAAPVTRDAIPRRQLALWLVLLAAAGTYALTMGTRQTMGLFLSPINTATGLGLAQISLAFAFGQVFWGLAQPFAGAVADKRGPGTVLLVGMLLVALGTFITPFMTTTAGLIFSIAVLYTIYARACDPVLEFLKMSELHSHEEIIEMVLCTCFESLSAR